MDVHCLRHKAASELVASEPESGAQRMMILNLHQGDEVVITLPDGRECKVALNKAGSRPVVGFDFPPDVRLLVRKNDAQRTGAEHGS